jgi:hypothetical protein
MRRYTALCPPACRGDPAPADAIKMGTCCLVGTHISHSFEPGVTTYLGGDIFAVRVYSVEEGQDLGES